MWSRNHAYSKLRELALGRAIPFAKLPEFRTREATLLFSYFFLQVHNKTRYTWVVVFYQKFFPSCVLINLMTSLKFEKIWLLSKSKNVFWIFEKNTKKSFFILFLSRNRIVYFWIKKNEEMNVSFVFFKKNWKMEKLN